MSLSPRYYEQKYKSRNIYTSFINMYRDLFISHLISETISYNITQIESGFDMRFGSVN